MLLKLEWNSKTKKLKLFHVQWNLNYDHLSDFLQNKIQQVPGTTVFSPAYSLFDSTVPVRNFNCNENQLWLI